MIYNNSTTFFFLTLWLFTASSTSASTVSPTSYDMPNGYSANYHYWDETYNGSGNPHQDNAALSGGLGQLTDGIVGGPHYSDDLGNGHAFEWVGWIPPLTVKFSFSSFVTLESISLYMVQNQDQIELPHDIRLSFSDDGINFGDTIDYLPSPTELSAPTAQWIAIPTPRTALQVSLRFPNTDYSLGTPFVSEVVFNGATSVPEPNILTTIIGAVFGGAQLLRSRRK